jgi:hypothetical protein
VIGVCARRQRVKFHQEAGRSPLPGRPCTGAGGPRRVLSHGGRFGVGNASASRIARFNRGRRRHRLLDDSRHQCKSHQHLHRFLGCKLGNRCLGQVAPPPRYRRERAPGGAANANIGVAKAAYYPSLSLSGVLGYENASLNHLFSLSNRFWSVGPSLAETLFDGGARRALTNQAIANYDASVAVYRETVLAALQDTEDNLVSLRVLADEVAVQDEATKAADEPETIALNQYKSGVVSYLSVIVAQTTALSNERASLSVRGRELASSIALIKSLGGSWSPIS